MRADRRYQTRFGSWVRGYTVSRLTIDLNARGLGVTQHAVYGWLSGRITPHPSRAIAVIDLSRSDSLERQGTSAGAISLEDIYRHRSEVGG